MRPPRPRILRLFETPPKPCYTAFMKRNELGQFVGRPASTRYWPMVDKCSKEECWPWLGKARTGKSGLYGQFWVNSRQVSAHRYSYELAYGPIPPGLHVLHKCDNPICQNPKHLYVGTNQDNVNDKMARGHWRGGRPKFIPQPCPRCGRSRRIVKGYCRSCYSTVRRRIMGRDGTGPSPF